MRTSDWSSDVCSSDLNVFTIPKRQVRHELGGNGGVQVAKGLPIDVRVDDLGNGDAEVARQRCLGAGHDVDGNVVEIASDLHEQSSFVESAGRRYSANWQRGTLDRKSVV